MRLVVRSEGKASEWNLIELQGELLVPEGGYDSKEIGKLSERDGVQAPLGCPLGWRVVG